MVSDGEFVVSGGDCAVAFESVDAALRGLVLLVGCGVESPQSAATSLGLNAHLRYLAELNDSFGDPSLSPGFIQPQRETIRRMFERLRRDPGLANRLMPVLLFGQIGREVDADAPAGRPVGVPEPGYSCLACRAGHTSNPRSAKAI